jgi:hypothetical protein
MKTLVFLVMLLSIITSCQGQPQPPQTQSTTTTPSIPNLLGDTIPRTSLPDNLQAALVRRLQRDSSIVDVRFVSRPFPQAGVLFSTKKIRCNMSPTRSFFAELSSMRFDRGLSRNDYVWEGRLTETGETLNRPDFNYIALTITEDNTAPSGYRFSSGFLKVSSNEAYFVEQFGDDNSPYWIVQREDPSKLFIALCNGIPSTP